MTYTELQKELNLKITEIARKMHLDTYSDYLLKDIYNLLLPYTIEQIKSFNLNTILEQSLIKNIEEFLAGKNFIQYTDMIANLSNRTGYQQFLNKSLNINELYNNVYFKTETDTMTNQLLVAQKIDNADKNLNLNDYSIKYIATNDDLTRPLHRALNGIIKPHTDPFWNKYMPPIAYNCRCSIQFIYNEEITQAQKDSSNSKTERVIEMKKDSKDYNSEINHNIFATGKFFNDKHTYMQVDDLKQKTAKLK